jgi:CheY-like chemotaxis protein
MLMSGSTIPESQQEQGQPAPVRVMISYAHDDESLRKEFDQHLALLRNRNLIEVWKDRSIRPGEDWAAEIKESMSQADIILLLISPAFFASSYIANVELALTREQEEKREVCVIPVIMREGDYADWAFSRLKELPTDGLAEGRSVSGRRWRNHDEAFRSVTQGIRAEVDRIHGKRLERHAVKAYQKQGVEPSQEDRAEIRTIGELFGRIVAGRRVLWVDDNPQNNVAERAALIDLGVNVETATTTAQALEAMDARQFDIVISDWSRGGVEHEGRSEGLTLLQQIRERPIVVPLIFYSGCLPASEFAARREQAAREGAGRVTCSPRELLRWIIGELVRCAAFDSTAQFVELPLYPEEA